MQGYSGPEGGDTYVYTKSSIVGPRIKICLLCREGDKVVDKSNLLIVDLSKDSEWVLLDIIALPETFGVRYASFDNIPPSRLACAVA
jgi:hypothetical protein